MVALKPEPDPCHPAGDHGSRNAVVALKLENRESLVMISTESRNAVVALKLSIIS